MIKLEMIYNTEDDKALLTKIRNNFTLIQDKLNTIERRLDKLENKRNIVYANKKDLLGDINE